ncbi:DNA cytosine methyltransferase [Sphingomicrobium aestuariivivum]|uniref:DNA cytosine methyltransferase n=1 Tax=Sphingomicrobium aestuariivivum TaxID=1582356 RepID=UPI001FD66A5C|nr:DNA cytosine methyltransferase [Sphingomicrobium aestuariivivum]MCJ8190713.1 DNA cytosine methyltransferase [Sphingomicrobium aestuariivivum]
MLHDESDILIADDGQTFEKEWAPVQRPMIDLFAGCGGLSLGFEQAGFTPILVNELNNDARDTYLANREHRIGGEKFHQLKQLHSADVAELDTARLNQVEDFLNAAGEAIKFGDDGNVDVLAGGPPCQGYSGIGHRRSYAVDKAEIPSNRLYEKMAGVIEHVRPRLFLFENVKGLLSSRWTKDGRKGEIWDDVYGRFKKLGEAHGYAVRWKLVYAKDYGVPQNRPRVLIAGIRNDILDRVGDLIDLSKHEEDAVLCGLLPGPTQSAPDLEDIFGDLIDETVPARLANRDFVGGFATGAYPRQAKTAWQRYFRPGALARELHPVTEHEYSKHSEKVVAKFQAMLDGDGSVPEEYKTKKFAQRRLRRRWGNQGPTITACSLPDDYVHFEQPRSLTVREWARLQTFPDTYVFKGKRTTGGLRRAGNPKEGIFEREVPKYTQIGNAVPVKLAEAVAKHFDTILNKAGY